MTAKPTTLEEVRVLRRLAPTIGFVTAAGLAILAGFAARAHAQTNIDQGKTPSEIFASDCAVCHKSPRGLADGKNSLMLSSFLREHYTASKDQAAALAAYVLGAGSGPPQTVTQKPERAKAAAVEEPKNAEPKPAHPARAAAKPEGEAPATANARPENAKPDEAGASPGESGVAVQRPASARREPHPAIASRGRKPETEPSAPAPVLAAPAVVAAPVAAAPAAAEPPVAAQTPNEAASPAPSEAGASTTSASAPAESQPGESAPVPRDEIPD